METILLVGFLQTQVVLIISHVLEAETQILMNIIEQHSNIDNILDYHNFLTGFLYSLGLWTPTNRVKNETDCYKYN